MANTTSPLKRGRSKGFGRSLLDLIRNGFRGIPVGEFTFDFYVKYSDFSDADTSEELDLNVTFPKRALPTNIRIRDTYAELVQEFAGGTVSAATVEVGDTGDPNERFTALNVFTGAGTGLKTVTEGALPRSFEAAYAPVLKLDTTGGNINTLTAGIIRISFVCEMLNAQGTE